MSATALERIVLQSLPTAVENLVVAVSGGIDSVVLLTVLVEIRRSRRLSLEAAHLDHRIRPESGADAAFVEQLCRRLEVPFHGQGCDVPALARDRGISLEMAGRQARRDFLLRVAGRTGAGLIALGHHRDDLAETFLLRLVRGTGMSGLRAMAVRQDIWWRPLLGVSRRDLVAYAGKRQLDWTEDDTNQNADIARNCLRHQVVPVLRQLNPQVDEHIAELCRQVQAEEDFWRQQVDQALSQLTVCDQDEDGLVLKREALAALHPALRLRVLRESLHRVRGDLQGISSRHLRTVDALVTGLRSQAQLDLPRCWVGRRYGLLRFLQRAPELAAPFDLALRVPGRTPLPDGRVVVATQDIEVAGESRDCIELDPEQLDGPLRIRSWRQGDRFAPAGMKGHKKLKRYFSDNKMSLEERVSTPLLVAGEVVLWIIGRRRSRHARGKGDGRPVIRLRVDKKADN